MPGNLNEIKKKIRATKNTRKITKAMQLVAASKMRVFQRKAIHSREFSWDLLEVLRSNLEEQLETPLTEQREVGKTLFVLYTSDKGLCGALNSRILKTLMNSKKWNDLSEDDRLLMTIGKKSYDFATFRGMPIAKHFNSIDEKLEVIDALDIISEIIKYWSHHKVKEVVMVAPHYKNSLIYYPVMKTYLPFSRDMVHQHVHVVQNVEGTDNESKEAYSDEPLVEYEPGPERFAEVLIEQIVAALFMQSFLELKASEYSSRMIAMQNATDAAGDMIHRYSLQYNKARQAAITQEIAEIVGGSMA